MSCLCTFGHVHDNTLHFTLHLHLHLHLDLNPILNLNLNLNLSLSLHYLTSPHLTSLHISVFFVLFFPFLSFPFLSFPFLSFPFLYIPFHPEKCLNTELFIIFNSTQVLGRRRRVQVAMPSRTFMSAVWSKHARFPPFSATFLGGRRVR